MGYALFQSMMGQIREESVGYLFNLEVQVQSDGENAVIEAEGPRREGGDERSEYSAPSIDGDVEVRDEQGRLEQAATARAQRRRPRRGSPGSGAGLRVRHRGDGFRPGGGEQPRRTSRGEARLTPQETDGRGGASWHRASRPSARAHTRESRPEGARSVRLRVRTPASLALSGARSRPSARAHTHESRPERRASCSAARIVAHRETRRTPRGVRVVRARRPRSRAIAPSAPRVGSRPPWRGCGRARRPSLRRHRPRGSS